MKKEIITSRAEEYKMERDWYIDALDMIANILSELDTPFDNKIRRIEDVISSSINNEPVTSDSERSLKWNTQNVALQLYMTTQIFAQNVKSIVMCIKKVKWK